MKKASILSTILCVVVLGISSQGNSSQTTPESNASPANADATATANPPASATPSKPAITAPVVSPQVQKLIDLYPRLVARIAPHGKVCFDGQECDVNISVLAAAVDGEPRSGEMIYKAVCKTCHETGLVGAPKIGDKGAWASRIGKGTATLYNNAINGFNAMPAKGGNSELLDAEVQNAVDYMIAQSS